MASSSPDQEPPPQLPPLLYKTWVLKVSIHCPACKRKVKKVLQTIEGVYTTEIDMQKQKVMVTGNVEAETLIKKLVRNGRSAELWPEPKPPAKGKKAKQHENSEDDDEQEDDDDNEKPAPENNTNSGPKKHGSVRFGAVETITLDGRMPENAAAVEKFPGAEQKSVNGGSGGGSAGGGGGAKKKKKKKKKKSNSTGNASAGPNGAPAGTESEVGKMDLSHPLPNNYSGPYDQNPPPAAYYVPHHHQAYVVSYNAAHPSISQAPAYYYIPSSPYMQSDKQSMPLESFEMMSDENPHACYIM